MKTGLTCNKHASFRTAICLFNQSRPYRLGSEPGEYWDRKIAWVLQNLTQNLTLSIAYLPGANKTLDWASRVCSELIHRQVDNNIFWGQFGQMSMWNPVTLHWTNLLFINSTLYGTNLFWGKYNFDLKLHICEHFFSTNALWQIIFVRKDILVNLSISINSHFL